MAADTLLFSLLAGGLGAILVWWAARAACARFAAGAALRGNAEGKGRPQESMALDSGQISKEEIKAVYRRVFWRRVGGMLLCLTALGAWLMGAHWLTSLLLAGMGCLLQYLAYRLRTCYALCIARQKQEQKMTAMSGAATAESPRASMEKKRRCPVL